MSAILILVVLLSVVIALALISRKRNSHLNYFPQQPPVVPQSLFDLPTTKMIAQMDYEESRLQLLERARQGDLSVLDEIGTNKILYDEVLCVLMQIIDISQLTSYIVRQPELSSNKQLAEAVIDSWQEAPSRSGLGQMLHLAALSHEAEIYWHAVETAKQAWDEGRLTQVSPKELATAIEAEFWLLQPAARESGTGFVLRRFVTDVRRELHDNSTK